MPPSRARLHELYFGDSRDGIRFQALWLIFDVLLISFFVASPFIRDSAGFLTLDYLIAAALALDLIARAWAYGDLKAWLKRPLVWADLAVLASLVVPYYAANLGFLRILRAFSMVHGTAFWRVLGGGRWMNTDAADTVKAMTNLAVFIFMMAALVHSTFAARVPTIASFMDSLYFTVATLTTTGFGDIVLPGFWGRGLSIIIMIGGVSLFFRLIQVAMRTGKVRHACTRCGLLRHDPDAVHCKACGEQLNIAHDND